MLHAGQIVRRKDCPDLRSRPLAPESLRALSQVRGLICDPQIAATDHQRGSVEALALHFPVRQLNCPFFCSSGI